MTKPQTKSNLTVLITNAKEKSKFKFIFEDATVTELNADGYRDAAILALSNRIRANKSKKIIGAWVKNQNGWENIVQDSVVIQLK